MLLINTEQWIEQSHNIPEQIWLRYKIFTHGNTGWSLHPTYIFHKEIMIYFLAYYYNSIKN